MDKSYALGDLFKTQGLLSSLFAIKNFSMPSFVKRFIAGFAFKSRKKKVLFGRVYCLVLTGLNRDNILLKAPVAAGA